MPFQVDVSSTSSNANSMAVSSKPIHELIDRSADPPRVAQYLEEFGTRHRAIFSALAQDGEVLRGLAAIFACSRFLSEELLRHPDWIVQPKPLHNFLSLGDYKTRLQEFLKERLVTRPAALDLAMFRRRE